MLISSVQQSDSVIQVYICIFFHILFHYVSPQDIEYRSLCYTVGPCCISILFIIAASVNPKLPIPLYVSLNPLQYQEVGKHNNWD